LLGRRADTAEPGKTTSSAAEDGDAGGGVVETGGGVVEGGLPADTADNVEQQDIALEPAPATPVAPHSGLVGVKNAIDASYVSCRRHLSRRV